MLQQIGKALKLNDQQTYELATIKLSGPAQEWFYHQDDEIKNWSIFKEVFLQAFPAPIQPANINYLAQLIGRKQAGSQNQGGRQTAIPSKRITTRHVPSPSLSGSGRLGARSGSGLGGLGARSGSGLGQGSGSVGSGLGQGSGSVEARSQF
ncbi:unnamed protein product [Adineta steineri]|uniref:Retrotransposon gag domain-containing protein n=1 Tax=Adineta steineri TaxID=433720 RepID=A0A819HBJ7_9BILA|nr:unnamed protein product [Adineta steineri]